MFASHTYTFMQLVVIHTPYVTEKKKKKTPNKKNTCFLSLTIIKRFPSRRETLSVNVSNSGRDRAMGRGEVLS